MAQGPHAVVPLDPAVWASGRDGPAANSAKASGFVSQAFACSARRSGGQDRATVARERAAADGARHLEKGDPHLCGPVTIRFCFIEDHRTVWLAPVMCGVLQVTQPGYRAWRARLEGKCTAENQVLLDEIRTAHAASGGRYGSPRVDAAPRAGRRGVGWRQVERLMRHHNVRGWLPNRDACRPSTTATPSRLPPTC